jgi:hypothetical protein
MRNKRNCKSTRLCIDRKYVIWASLCIGALLYTVSRAQAQQAQAQQAQAQQAHINAIPTVGPAYSYGKSSNATYDRDVYLNPYAAPLRDTRCAPDTRDSVSSYDIRGDIGPHHFYNQGSAAIHVNKVPINVPTQGCLADTCYDAPYRQIGILSNNGDVLPLMGRPLIANRDKWQFYTIGRNGIKLPINSQGRNCTSEYGCDNVSSGDDLTVEGYNKQYKVTIYENNAPRYLPVL